jgi:hypothetical protein
LSDFDVFQLCWEPDYDRFFLDQLKKRSINIFLFRGEFIFELARTVVAEGSPGGQRHLRIHEARGYRRIRAALCRDNAR